jgi:hypothetical protein
MNWIHTSLIVAAVFVTGFVASEARTTSDTREITSANTAFAFGNAEFTVTHAYFTTSDGKAWVCVTSANTPSAINLPRLNGTACQEIQLP